MSSADYQRNHKTSSHTLDHRFTALCFLLLTLISHVRTKPCLKLEKFSSGAAAAQQTTEWQKLIELMVRVSEEL